MTKQYFKTICLLFLAMLGMAQTAAAETVTAEWSWQTSQPATITSVNIERTTGTVASTVDGIDLYVDATNGKLKSNGDNVAFNAGTILRVPVVSTKDVVTVKAHPYQFSSIKIGGNDFTTQETYYTATSFDVNQGYVEIVSTSSPYLYSIKVVQNKTAAETAFKNIVVNLIDNTLMTSEVTAKTAFGINVAADGTLSVVEANATNANISFTASNYNGYQHGWTNLVATVKVDGPVKVTLGGCNFGGHDATITDAANNKTNFSVAATCWDSNKPTENVGYAYYKGTDATTLTIKCASWTPYIAIEAANPADLKDEATVSFAAGEATDAIVPASIKDEVGKSITLPKNFTMYVEGKTLTGWSDGTDTYAPGAAYEIPAADITLQPVFTANEVSLADRTEPVTVTFALDGNNGHQRYNQNNGIIVTPVTIGSATIDVKADITGTIQTNNNGWHQVKNSFVITVPSAKGATIAINTYGDPTGKITFGDGASAETTGSSGNYTITSTILDATETIDIKQTDAEYWRNIAITLPVVQSAGGKTYTDAEANVRWPFKSHETISTTEKTADVFSTTSFEILGDLTTSTKTGVTQLGTGTRSQDPDNGLAFLTFTGESNMQLHWNIKPVSGLTFTPTQIKMYVQRFGTDKEDGVVITAKKEDGTIQTLGTYTARRANWTTEQEKTKFKWTEVPATLVNEVVIDLTADQQTALASADGFHLYAVTGLGNEKAGGFSDIRVYGKVNGTAADVAKYTLDIAASPAEGGSVTKYPNSDEYEEGSTIKVTATENFGYNFENWTDESGTEVSKEPVYQFDIAKNEKLTANFVAVNTYELKLTVDGTNDYMVKVSPAPTVVDGKNMYEAGTAVELTADQYEGLVTFTNWSDGETNSKKTISMTEDVTLTANYAEADIIAGWDFYKAGNNGRVADFAAQDNDADALNLVKTGTTETSGWLDKSTLGGGGYESFKGAATNWRTGSSNGDVGNYHWQTKVNAEAFTDIKVQFQMMYNYNAYQKYNAEYSLNGTDWTNFGSITMSGAKAPASFSETLPAEANNQKDLYIRMIADKESNIDGTASANDGNTLAMFFITGTPKLVDDGTAPVLVSSVPANNATGASASGKIVLNFDEKVKVADAAKATLGSLELTPAVSGKVVTFDYKGLEYNSEYTFTLPANSVADQTDNYLAEAITINFTTMNRPSVTKKLYDQVVSTTDELVAAINAANSRADKNTRYRIFVKNGEYTIPLSSTMKTVNGYEVPECITSINGSNTSFIGESRDGVVITNGIEKSATFEGQYGTTSKYDGIGNSDVFQISSSTSGLYWQDLTVSTGMDDATGRDLAIQDKGTMNIYKNVKLHGFQDTWTSNNDNGLYYFEDGVIRGRTDYICGKGDIYFNRVEFRQIAGGYAAVPSKPAKVGWVMKDCVINGEAAVTKMENGVATQRATAEQADGNYTLGRPWGKGTPVALWIDTKMNVVPSAIGWEEMSGGFPKRFAEYNSTTKTGNVIDLSGRKDVFDAYDEKKEVIVDNVKTYEYVNRRNEHNSPVLTAAEALEYSDMSKMFGDWTPTLATEQAPVPQNVKQNGNNLEWDDSNYALLYAVVKDGEIIDFTTENSYEMPEDGTYSVRAANEMGGLSEASATVEATGVTTGIQNVKTADEAPVITGDIYTLQGVRVDKARKGLYIIGGRKVVIK